LAGVSAAVAISSEFDMVNMLQSSSRDLASIHAVVANTKKLEAAIASSDPSHVSTTFEKLTTEAAHPKYIFGDVGINGFGVTECDPVTLAICDAPPLMLLMLYPIDTPPFRYC
jgi:hypothetical protein